MIGISEHIDYHKAAPTVTYQNRAEFDWLLEIVREAKPERILEIGSLLGGSLWHWLRIGKEVVSIDMLAEDDERRFLQKAGHDGLWQRWAREAGSKLAVIEADSTKPETVSAVREVMPEIDFLFIDGGHDTATVRKDWALYSSMVKSGGLIALHDIAFNEESPYFGVKPFWERLKREHRTEEMITRTGELGIGVVYL